MMRVREVAPWHHGFSSESDPMAGSKEYLPILPTPHDWQDPWTSSKDDPYNGLSRSDALHHRRLIGVSPIGDVVHHCRLIGVSPIEDRHPPHGSPLRRGSHAKRQEQSQQRRKREPADGGTPAPASPPPPTYHHRLHQRNCEHQHLQFRARELASPGDPCQEPLAQREAHPGPPPSTAREVLYTI